MFSSPFLVLWLQRANSGWEEVFLLWSSVPLDFQVARFPSIQCRIYKAEKMNKKTHCYVVTWLPRSLDHHLSSLYLFVLYIITWVFVVLNEGKRESTSGVSPQKWKSLSFKNKINIIFWGITVIINDSIICNIQRIQNWGYLYFSAVVLISNLPKISDLGVFILGVWGHWHTTS